MKLYFHKDPLGNFGDDLNPWLFEKLLPGIFQGHCYHDPALRPEPQNDADAREPLFVGIGTLLNDRIPKAPLKAVFGSGTGYGPSSTLDERWHVYCVRGPKTAELLGLPADRAITDAAALCRRIDIPDTKKPRARHAFMPHCSTARLGSWDRIAADLDIAYIDPQASVEAVFDALKATDVLITEAMHGAILADTLRIPWIPVSTTPGILSLKWQDWCASLDMTYDPCRLPSLWKPDEPANLTKRMTGMVKHGLARRALRTVLDKAKPKLSDEDLLERRVDQLEGCLERFRSDVGQGRYGAYTADTSTLCRSSANSGGSARPKAGFDG